MPGAPWVGILDEYTDSLYSGDPHGGHLVSEHLEECGIETQIDKDGLKDVGCGLGNSNNDLGGTFMGGDFLSPSAFICYVSPSDWSGLLTGYDYGPRFIISHGLVIRWHITCTIMTHS